MGDGFAAEFSNGKKNVWSERIEFLKPESEHSSDSAFEYYALAGGRVTNFTPARPHFNEGRARYHDVPVKRGETAGFSASSSIPTSARAAANA